MKPMFDDSDGYYILVDKDDKVYPHVFHRLRDAKGKRTNLNNQPWARKREYKIHLLLVQGTFLVEDQ